MPEQFNAFEILRAEKGLRDMATRISMHANIECEVGWVLDGRWMAVQN